MPLNMRCYYFFGFEHALVYYALSVFQFEIMENNGFPSGEAVLDCFYVWCVN